MHESMETKLTNKWDEKREKSQLLLLLACLIHRESNEHCEMVRHSLIKAVNTQHTQRHLNGNMNNDLSQTSDLNVKLEFIYFRRN